MVTTMRGANVVLLVDMAVMRALYALQEFVSVVFAGTHPEGYVHPGGCDSTTVLFTSTSHEL
jgi:hypothetical protein